MLLMAEIEGDQTTLTRYPCIWCIVIVTFTCCEHEMIKKIKKYATTTTTKNQFQNYKNGKAKMENYFAYVGTSNDLIVFLLNKFFSLLVFSSSMPSHINKLFSKQDYFRNCVLISDINIRPNHIFKTKKE